MKKNYGWIKLDRSILYDEVFKNPHLFKVYMWCLMKASHQNRRQLVGNQIVDIQRGQFVFGRHKAAHDLHMKEGTFRQHMKTLIHLRKMTIKSTTKFSIATVCNYDSCAIPDTTVSPTNTPTDCQQTATNKNDIELKECFGIAYQDKKEFIDMLGEGFTPTNEMNERNDYEDYA